MALNRIPMNIDLKFKKFNNYVAQQNDNMLLDIDITESGVAKDLSKETLIVNYVNANNTIAVIAGNKVVVNGNNVKISCPTDCSRSNGQAKFSLTIKGADGQTSTYPININIEKGVIDGQAHSENVATIVEDLNNASLEATQKATELANVIATADTTTYATKGEYKEVKSSLEESKIQINTKVDKVSGKGLSTNDYIDSDKVEVSKIKNKMDKNTTDINVGQINPNLGKFGESYLTEELLAKIAGTAGINSTPGNQSISTIKMMDKVVIPQKTSFLKCSSNLYNHNTIQIGKVIGTNGVITDNSSYLISDFIEVMPNIQYSTYGVLNIAYYTADRVFISRGNLDPTGSSFIPPTNAYYVRFNTQNISTYKSSQQVNSGGSLLQYEKWYKPYLYEVDIPNKSIEYIQLKNDGVLAENIDFLQESSNLYDFRTDIERIIILADGNISENNTYNTSDFIKVAPKQMYSIFGFANISLYDKDKNFVKRITPQNGYQDSKLIIEEDIYYIRGSYQPSNVNKERRVNKGGTLKDLEEYYIKFKNKSYFKTLNEVIEKRKDKYMFDVPIDGVFNTNEIYTDYTTAWTTITPSEVYALFDELMNQYPSYISKEILGSDSFGNSISAYYFTPSLPASDSVPKIPKVFLTCGTHGSEKASTLTTYLTMKQICEKWEECPLLEALRFNVNFIIIPIVNPSGWIAFTRQNGNGVDINRNFPYNWTLSVKGDSQYGGEYPLSELESQYVKRLFDENKDIDIMYDFHNFHNDNTSKGYFSWIPTNNEPVVQHMAQNLFSKLTRKWRKELSFIPNDYDYFIGYTSREKGGMIQNYAQSIGVKFSATLEICWKWDLDTSSIPYNKDMCKCGVEILVNWLLINLKELIR